jgi:putative serine protease PepD
MIAKTADAIVKGGPAAKAGLKSGDIITVFDGRSITSADELIVAIRSKNVGDKVTISYKRDASTKSATLTLTASE